MHLAAPVSLQFDNVRGFSKKNAPTCIYSQDLREKSFIPDLLLLYIQAILFTYK